MTVYANARILVMDDAGTEHERGWLRVEDGLVAEVVVHGLCASCAPSAGA